MRLAVVVWTVALGLAGTVAGLVVSGGRIDHLFVELGVPLLVGLTFVAAGLVSWTRRPQNRTGALMTAVPSSTASRTCSRRPAPFARGRTDADAGTMTKTLLIGVIVLGLLVLALGGWTVKGIRRLRRSRPQLRPTFAA